jgi:hypothetical protein
VLSLSKYPPRNPYGLDISASFLAGLPRNPYGLDIPTTFLTDVDTSRIGVLYCGRQSGLRMVVARLL